MEQTDEIQVSSANESQGLALVDQAIHSARRAGRLESSSVWAFITMVLIGYIWWKEKSQRKIEERRQSVRLEDAKSDILQANALHDLSKQVERQASILENLSTIIDERLPRR